MICRCEGRAFPLPRPFAGWGCGASRSRVAAPVSVSGGAVADASGLTGSRAIVNAKPYPVSLANTPATADIGTETSCDVPEKRAEKRTPWLSIVRWRVADGLTLSTISPFLTYADGTRVCAFTLTLR